MTTPHAPLPSIRRTDWHIRTLQAKQDSEYVCNRAKDTHHDSTTAIVRSIAALVASERLRVALKR